MFSLFFSPLFIRVPDRRSQDASQSKELVGTQKNLKSLPARESSTKKTKRCVSDKCLALGGQKSSRERLISVGYPEFKLMKKSQLQGIGDFLPLMAE